MSFKKNKYTVLKKAISKELADFVYKYFLNKRNVARFLFDQKYISPFLQIVVFSCFFIIDNKNTGNNQTNNNSSQNK